MNRGKNRRLLGLALAAVCAISLVASGCSKPSTTKSQDSQQQAANYPSGPVTILVGHKAGGSTDIIARLLQPYLQKSLGSNIVIQNVEGGGGNDALSQLYKAKPDGYTLCLAAFPSTMLGELVKNGDFKTMDFTYLNSITGDDYNAIFVKYDSPYTDLKSLVAAAKTSRITMSGSGIGTNSDMARTLLQNAAGVTFEYVSFDSGTEGATAVAGGHTVSGVGNMVSLKQLADAKKIRILACIGNKRHPNFPDVPTAPEEGFSAATMDVCVGMIAPPNMPADLSKKISDAINAAASDQQFKNDAVKSGSNMVLLGPSDFKSQVEKIYQQADALKDQMKSK